MSRIAAFKNVSKSYGGLQVIDGVNLEVDSSELMVLYGLPSSGKSVLLRLLVGLEKPDKGEIFLRGRDVAKVPPKGRGLRYIPQDFALFPNKNVFENIAYPLRLARGSATDINRAVDRAAGMLSIRDLLEKLPTQLSGGQKQRVAIARGLVMETDIYIFDDPLAGLDFKLREQLIDDLRALQESLRACFIYATSDPLEAMALGTRLAVLDEARIQETGPPESIYLNPQTAAAMNILGFPRTNFLPGELASGGPEPSCRTGLFSFPLEASTTGLETAAGQEVLIGIRPENILLAPREGDLLIKGEIILKEDLGAEEIVYFRAGDTDFKLVCASDENGKYDVGDRLNLGLKPTSLMVFDRANGQLLGTGRSE